PPASCRLPVTSLLSSEHSFPAAALPSASTGDTRRRRGKNAPHARSHAHRLLLPRGECLSGRLACASVRAPGPNDRLSVWNLPRSQAPSTVYASSVRHACTESPPIERTVPSQVHPAAQRRPSPTTLPPPRPLRPPLLNISPASFLSSTRPPRRLRRRGRRLGVTPRRRVPPQPPVLLPGAFRHLPVLHQTPQGDQQLPRQGHD